LRNNKRAKIGTKRLEVHVEPLEEQLQCGRK